jgi:D-glycerate 3-kinase
MNQSTAMQTPAVITTDSIFNRALLQALVQFISQRQLKIFAISGAQGSGKTTLAAGLQQALQQTGINCGVVSLDDYYWGRQERLKLAEQVHPLLCQRGVPGTHQISRLQQDLAAHYAGQPVALPRFDKALDDGVADAQLCRYDLLIIEGWCLGALPQQTTQLALPVNSLDLMPDAAHWRFFQNEQLQKYYLPLWSLLQPMLYLRAPDWPTVCLWRQQQEAALWRERGSGMTTAALQQFMLPFQRWTQAMLLGELAQPVQILQLDKNRNISTPVLPDLHEQWAKLQT